VWSFTSIIPALRRLRQEDLEFQASLGYIVCLKKKGKNFKSPLKMLFLHILILPAVSNALLLSTGPWRKHSSVVKIDAYRFLTFVNYRNIQTHSKQRARAMCPAPSPTITSFGQSWVTHTPKAPNRAKQIPDSLSAAGLDVDTHILSSFAGRCGIQQVVPCQILLVASRVVTAYISVKPVYCDAQNRNLTVRRLLLSVVYTCLGCCLFSMLTTIDHHCLGLLYRQSYKLVTL
jgi:hypothetical protein